MGTLHEFSRGPANAVPHPAVAVLPLVPCNADPIPDWSIVRLSEDRFRLTLAAQGMTENDIAVRLEGGLLHIDGPALRCLFLMLEPLQLVDTAVRNDRLIVDLQRDHATPCRAGLPPRLREAAALAMAA